MKDLTAIVRVAVMISVLLGVALLGAYSMHLRQVEREIAELPLVRLDPVVIISERTPSPMANGTRVAKNPVKTSLR